MKQAQEKTGAACGSHPGLFGGGLRGDAGPIFGAITKQLWVVDNSVDVQQDYVMENPFRHRGSDHAGAGSSPRRSRPPPSALSRWRRCAPSGCPTSILKPMLLNSDDSSVGEEQFTKNIEQAFDNVKALGLNTVIAQVRPFSDALYESELFPWSYLAGGEEGYPRLLTRWRLWWRRPMSAAFGLRRG